MGSGMSLLSLPRGLGHGLPFLCLMISCRLALTRRVLLPFSIAVLLPAAAGQDSEYRKRLERFQLFNACRPMVLVIESMDDDEAAIGLTKEALQAAAESRLRAARLYTEDMRKTDYASLYVSVHVVGRAYSILVFYIKSVTDEFGVTAKATTWFSAPTGTHGGDAGYIVSSLSRQLDKFLAEYLRVNEPACNLAPLSRRTP